MTTAKIEASAPRSTPWGHADHVSLVSTGIAWVSTDSHGGYWISAERRQKMPAQYRGFKTLSGGDWFEEDSDAVIVVLSFPECFDNVAAARELFDANRKYYIGRGSLVATN